MRYSSLPLTRCRGSSPYTGGAIVRMLYGSLLFRGTFWTNALSYEGGARYPQRGVK